MSTLKIDVEIMHPPALIWRALTEAKPLNEWFQPIAGWPESGARPGSQGRVSPTEDLKGFGSFDMYVVEAEPHSRLVERWRGDDFTSEVTFEIKPAPDGSSRLLMRQTGFLGTQEAQRRETLARAHQVMVGRLKGTLERMALGIGEGAFLAAEPLVAGRKFKQKFKAHHRMRIATVVGLIVVAALCGTAGAVWLGRGSQSPPSIAAPTSGGGGGEPSIGIGVQPLGSQTSQAPWRSPAVAGTKESAGASATRVTTEKPLTASYQTRALPAGLLGFDTEITVRNPGGQAKNGWTVVLTMPDATPVENRSGAVVKTRQEGAVVTVTPITANLPPGGGVTFVIRYPALIALGPSVKGCTVDGRACSAA